LAVVHVEVPLVLLRHAALQLLQGLGALALRHLAPLPGQLREFFLLVRGLLPQLEVVDVKSLHLHLRGGFRGDQAGAGGGGGAGAAADPIGRMGGRTGALGSESPRSGNREEWRVLDAPSRRALRLRSLSLKAAASPSSSACGRAPPASPNFS